jgi:hypothetical protein
MSEKSKALEQRVKDGKPEKKMFEDEQPPPPPPDDRLAASGYVASGYVADPIEALPDGKGLRTFITPEGRPAASVNGVLDASLATGNLTTGAPDL